MRSIRIAVWGLGRHAVNNIVPAVAGGEGIELYGVCSRSAEVVAGSAARWGCRGWMDADLMLRDPAVDAVYVATPIGLHAAHGARVLNAGKHLWCEKPVTTSLHDTQSLLAIAQKSRLSLCEAFMYLYHPQFERLARYLEDGTLGSIRSVSCRFGIPALERPGFRNVAALGGGALLDVGCYPVSAVHALFPEDSVQIVQASVRARPGSGVDTDGHAVLALTGGTEAFLEWRTGCAYRNEIDLWGEAGSVWTDKVFSKGADYVPEFRVRDVRGGERSESGTPCNHFSSMLQAFRGCVLDPAAAASERLRIARRAETLDMIRTRAGAG
jgi:NDP-hexose-3-ketoreductase